jgi:hypothetical protein
MDIGISFVVVLTVGVRRSERITIRRRTNKIIPFHASLAGITLAFAAATIPDELALKANVLLGSVTENDAAAAEGGH